MAIDLYHTESVIIVAVQYGLHGCRLSGTRISIKKNVIGGAAVQKPFRVFGKELFLLLITDKVIKALITPYRNRDYGAILLSVDPKGLVHTKDADPVASVKIRDHGKHGLTLFLSRFFAFYGFKDLVGKLPDPYGDIFVVYPVLLLDRLIRSDGRKMICPEALIKMGKIPKEKLHQDLHIISYKGIHRAVNFLCALRHEGIRGFRHRDKVGDEILPEIPVKAALGRKIEKHMDNGAPLGAKVVAGGKRRAVPFFF